MKYFINSLTFFRLFSGPIIFALLVLSFHPKIAFALFIIASLSDYFDGYLARKYSHESSFGEVLDPIADKILSISSLIALMINGIIEGFNIIPALIIIYREIFVSGLREYLGEKSIKVNVTYQSKLKTATQFTAISGFLISPVISPDISYFNYLCSFLLSLSALTSISTGFNYFKITSEFLEKK